MAGWLLLLLLLLMQFAPAAAVSSQLGVKLGPGSLLEAELQPRRCCPTWLWLYLSGVPIMNMNCSYLQQQKQTAATASTVTHSLTCRTRGGILVLHHSMKIPDWHCWFPCCRWKKLPCCYHSSQPAQAEN